MPPHIIEASPPHIIEAINMAEYLKILEEIFLTWNEKNFDQMKVMSFQDSSIAH